MEKQDSQIPQLLLEYQEYNQNAGFLLPDGWFIFSGFVPPGEQTELSKGGHLDQGQLCFGYTTI